VKLLVLFVSHTHGGMLMAYDRNFILVTEITSTQLLNISSSLKKIFVDSCVWMQKFIATAVKRF